jgi:hypothetical protein
MRKSRGPNRLQQDAAVEDEIASPVKSALHSKILAAACCVESAKGGCLRVVVQDCDAGPCPQFHYQAGKWQVCTRECGGGTQAREIRCMNTATNAIAPDSACQGLGLEVPVSEKPCNTEPCDSRVVVWSVKSIGPCDPPLCGGVRSQTVFCECVFHRFCCPFGLSGHQHSHSSALCKHRLESRGCHNRRYPSAFWYFVTAVHCGARCCQALRALCMCNSGRCSGTR